MMAVMPVSFQMRRISSCIFMRVKASSAPSGSSSRSTLGLPTSALARDARWGRVVESAGEDPYLGGEVGKAFIRGYHKGGIACCVKHFAGYGAAEAGRDYNTTDISEHSLDEYYLKGY